MADTWWILPGAEQSTGLLSWSLFDRRWDRRQDPRHHRCAALFRLELQPTAPCENCEIAWRVDAELTDTDCEGDLPDLLSLQAIGLGALAEELSGRPPYEQISTGSWAKYDDGSWEPHGWAFRDSPEAPTSETPVWNNDGAVTGWPGYAWPASP